MTFVLATLELLARSEARERVERDDLPAWRWGRLCCAAEVGPSRVFGLLELCRCKVRRVRRLERERVGMWPSSVQAPSLSVNGFSEEP